MTAAPFWRLDAPLVLASRSRARAAMLWGSGVPVETDAADIDERAIEADLAAAGASPAMIATGLAREKASVVAAAWPGRLVLGADQVLAHGGERFSKAADVAEGAARLARLSGRMHQLHSAFALLKDGRVLEEGVATATLTMRPMSPEFIALYAATVPDALTESVGGYRLEDVGAQLFERIEGDYFTVLGMPLLDVLGALRRAGALAA